MIKSSETSAWLLSQVAESIKSKIQKLQTECRFYFWTHFWFIYWNNITWREINNWIKNGAMKKTVGREAVTSFCHQVSLIRRTWPVISNLMTTNMMKCSVDISEKALESRAQWGCDERTMCRKSSAVVVCRSQFSLSRMILSILRISDGEQPQLLEAASSLREGTHCETHTHTHSYLNYPEVVTCTYLTLSTF